MFKNFKIREKLLLIFGIVIIFTATVISVVNYKITSNGLRADLLAYSDKYLVELSYNLDGRIEKLNNDIFYRMMGKGLQNEKSFNKLMGSISDSNSDKIEIIEGKKIISDIIVSNMHIESLAITDLMGNVYYQNRKDRGSGEQILTSILMNEKEKNTVLRRINEDSFSIIKPILDINTTKTIGYIAFEVSHKFFTDEFRKNDSSSDWDIIILDENNELLTSENDNVKEIFDEITMNYNLKGTMQRSIIVDNKEFIFNTNAMPSGQLRIMNIIPTKVIRESSYELMKVIIIACIVVSIFALFTVIIISSSVSNNINLLINKMNEISKGNFNTKIHINSKDEIGIIADEFNKMSAEINTLIEEVYVEQLSKEKIQRKAIEFEYGALQAKMNPHFIYNVLEGINSMAKIDGNEDISKVSILLGELIGSSISDDRATIYLEDEIEYVKNYCELKKIMRNDEFEVNYDIDEMLLGALIPKFILQPIVENAVTHGIDKRSGKGIINIKCYEKEKDLYLVVIDNGVGFDYNKESEISPDSITLKKWRRTHVGLKSIDKRLKILYGDKYGLYVDKETLMGAHVEITLPYITNSNLEGNDIDVPSSDS